MYRLMIEKDKETNKDNQFMGRNKNSYEITDTGTITGTNASYKMH